MLTDRCKQAVVSSLPFYRGSKILNTTHIFFLTRHCSNSTLFRAGNDQQILSTSSGWILHSISSVITRSVRKLFDLSNPSLNWWSLRDKLINIEDSGLQGCKALLSSECFSIFRSNVVFLSLRASSPNITNRNFVILNICRVFFLKRENVPGNLLVFLSFYVSLYKFNTLSNLNTSCIILQWILNCTQTENFYIIIISLRERTERKFRSCGFLHGRVYFIIGQTIKYLI
jgi:hypothetical protein